ncbi:hypothetical protein HPB52_011712 [Rhipicephalus sanguineus]|uniref:Uncharacterized protein n=1 Tax=Rhipicephalus sanguineus TaxID=34632 RepID=A0A9D4T3U8_RHISA|nr:hypothetical protein HPB52_011712 [Rhipicephalus sanguineus]
MSAEERTGEGNDAKVDINTSSVDDLAGVVGLGRAAAEAIVAARRLQGGFNRVEDLLAVPGVDVSLLQELQLSLTCSPRENLPKDTQGTRWGSGSSSSCGSRDELATPSKVEATSLATSVNRLLHSEGLPTSDDDEGSCSSVEDMAEGDDDQAALSLAGSQLKRKREEVKRPGGKKPCGWEASYTALSTTQLAGRHSRHLSAAEPPNFSSTFGNGIVVALV